MNEYVLFKKYDVQIDLGTSCDYKCSYCHLVKTGANIEPAFQEKSQLMDLLRSSKDFISGRNGTVITLGGYFSEPFHKNISNHTLGVMESLLALGNPMRIATKSFLTKEVCEIIGSFRIRPDQLLMNISFSTITKSNYFERNAPTPAERLETLANLKRINIPTTFLIKPVLPNITLKDTDKLLGIIETLKPDYVVCGILYDKSISNPETFMIQRYRGHIASANKQSIYDSTVLASKLKQFHDRVFLNGICPIINLADAHLMSYPDLDSPLLCVGCGKCKELRKSHC
jgi:DNA repair photolyase